MLLESGRQLDSRYDERNRHRYEGQYKRQTPPPVKPIELKREHKNDDARDPGQHVAQGAVPFSLFFTGRAHQVVMVLKAPIRGSGCLLPPFSGDLLSQYLRRHELVRVAVDMFVSTNVARAHFIFFSPLLCSDFSNLCSL